MECQWATIAPMPRMTRAESQAQTRSQLVSDRQAALLRGRLSPDVAGEGRRRRGLLEGCGVLELPQQGRTVHRRTRRGQGRAPRGDSRHHGQTGHLVTRRGAAANGPNGSSAIRGGRRWRSSSPCMPVTMSRCATIWPRGSPRSSKCSPMQPNPPTAPRRRLPGGETATVMLALGVGLGLLRSIDPAIPVNGLVDTLRLVSGQT